jgi:tetratricopeptide (TPR) repeat protein
MTIMLRLHRKLHCLALAGALMITAMVVDAAGPPPHIECTSSYDFTANNVDYLDPKWQDRIRGIESNHLNPDVENLVRGQSTATPGADLKFILNIVPNHHRALAALMRLAQRDRTEMPADSGPYPMRCWLQRATVFSPGDAQARIMYGVYLARIGLMKEGIEQLEKADEMSPNNPELNYNLGLLYFDAKDYARSLDRAKRAYAEGFPLPGLRNKLTRAGQWRD